MASRFNELFDKLLTVRVLYRENQTMCLWGVPYPMKPGQHPKDIKEMADTYRPGGPRVHINDWIWMGNPGWWAHLQKDEQNLIKDFLEEYREFVPNNPNEWAELPKE